MKNTLTAAAILTFVLALSRTGAAQDSAPADPAKAPAVQSDLPKADKPEPKTEAPAPKPAPKAAPEAKAEPEAEAPAAKPAAKAAPKPEAVKKPVETVKELNSFAKTFVPLADAYKKAYEEMQRWILDIDARTAGVAANISRIQDDIQKNEAAITKMKIAGGSERSEEGRGLAKENKRLWDDLSAARKERAALSKDIIHEAIQRAKGNQVDIIGKLEDIKAQAK